MVCLQTPTGGPGLPSNTYRGPWSAFKHLQGVMVCLQTLTGGPGLPSNTYRGPWSAFKHLQGALVCLQTPTGGPGLPSNTYRGSWSAFKHLTVPPVTLPSRYVYGEVHNTFFSLHIHIASTILGHVYGSHNDSDRD